MRLKGGNATRASSHWVQRYEHLYGTETAKQLGRADKLAYITTVGPNGQVMAHTGDCPETTFTVQYMVHLSPLQEWEVPVVPLRAYDSVLGLPLFQFRNHDVDWPRGRLLALRTPRGVEVVAVDRVDRWQCHRKWAGLTAWEEVCSGGGGGTPDTEVLGATAFDDVLASEQVVGTFFLRVGDCSGLLGATVEGITDGEWDRPKALDGRAGSSGSSCSRRVYEQCGPWMTATSTARHEGSTGWRGLALLWRTVLNPDSWRCLHTTPYQVWIDNERLQMELAQRPRWCLHKMEDISRQYSENSGRFSAKLQQRHSCPLS